MNAIESIALAISAGRFWLGPLLVLGLAAACAAVAAAIFRNIQDEIDED